jgi:hypothetical protein
MKKIVLSLVIAICVAPLSLHAGLFGWMGKKDSGETPGALSTNTVKRLHLTVADKAAEKELLQLTGVKRVLSQELQALRIMTGEKRRDLMSFDSEFEKSFGIRRDRNYRYDAKTMTIYEEEKALSATNTPPVAGEPKLLKKLDSEADSRKFASLAAGKQIVQDDLVVLMRLGREKDAAMARVESALKEKFSMSRDRNYWYDAKTMRLYEFVDSSSKGDVR